MPGRPSNLVLLSAMIPIPRIGVLLSLRARGPITIRAFSSSAGMSVLIALRRGVLRPGRRVLDLDALTVCKREGGPVLRILDNWTA
jgi:hypothetical protein